MNKGLSEHEDVFKYELGNLKQIQITTPVNHNIKQKFYRARPESDLNCLVNLKLVVTIFSQNHSPLNTIKNVFYFI